MIDKKIFKKVLTKAKHINKEIQDLRNLLAEDSNYDYFLEPNLFWLDTDIIPELKKEYGGEIERLRFFEDGVFTAYLTIDGVKFRTDFLDGKEWEKYE